jgi:hypothetical protein
MLFGIPKAKLDLKPQAVVLVYLLGILFQVGRKEQCISISGDRFSALFDQAYHYFSLHGH